MMATKPNPFAKMPAGKGKDFKPCASCKMAGKCKAAGKCLGKK
jgi:hypothetical protein